MVFLLYFMFWVIIYVKKYIQIYAKVLTNFLKSQVRDFNLQLPIVVYW